MIPKHMRAKYDAYMASSAWKKLRDEKVETTYITEAEAARDSLDLERGRYRCQKCEWNFERKDMEVHHLRYDNLGCEPPWDLAVVCKSCHDKLDAVRAKEGRRKSRETYEERGFERWAEKAYGEDWGAYYEESEVWEEFLEFLRGKGEGY